MKQNKNFILKEIAGIPYLLPFGQMIADHARGVQLNATGVYLWKLLEDNLTIGELLSLSANYYEIKNEALPEFENDIRQFINRLVHMGMIIADQQPLTEVNHDILTLSIGNLKIQLKGDAAAFPPELKTFSIPSCTSPHQTIFLQYAPPIPRKNGQVLIRNEELVVLDVDEEYILLFPTAKQIHEIRLQKDARFAVCYCTPPFTDTFHYDLFHAIRLVFLYLAQKMDMVAIHSASILYKDKIWIFSGRSGMGKSTHTNLWNALYNTPVINGDLNLLAIDKEDIVVHGMPWCGTSGICSTESYPLGGIILLNQAGTDYIEELALDKQILLTSHRLISPCWTSALYEKNIDLIAQMVSHIAVCKLHCTKEPHAAQVMKDYIDQIKNRQ